MTINDIDTNNSLINTFSERMVGIIDALPKWGGAGTDLKAVLLPDVIMALRTESAHERYQRPIRSFYDLSTAHVSPAARQWLELNAGANAMQRGGTAHPVAAFMFGWMMWVPNDLEGLHSDLLDACVEALRCGCNYMLFDADAEIIGTLPVWEEDETSLEGLSEQEIEALKLIHPEDGLPMDERTNAEVILDSLDPNKPADRRVLLDEESPTFGKAREAAQAAGKAAVEGAGEVYVIPADAPLHVTASGRRKAEEAGHVVLNRSAVSELKLAVADIMTDIEAEIEQRMTGMDAKTWSDFEGKRQRLAKAAGAL